MSVNVIHADMREALKVMATNGVRYQSCVCDPPYHLTSIVNRFGGKDAAPAKSNGPTGAYARASRGFMGKQWDGGDIAFRPETWALVYDLLPPGGHLIAFSGTRTYHRMACAIEDAGFEIRDMVLDLVASDAAVQAFMASLNDEQQAAFLRCLSESGFGGMLAWVYGSGFPKSHDFTSLFDKASLGIDPHADPVDWAASRSHFAAMWEGWGTALKPAFEPICFARKPLDGSVAENMAAYGVGGLNIDGCRLEPAARRTLTGGMARKASPVYGSFANQDVAALTTEEGRWPANIVHDGSAEVVAAFPSAPGQQRAVGPQYAPKTGTAVYHDYGPRPVCLPRGDSGSAERFFYSAKADAMDRLGSKHPTVKRVDLIRWLVRLVTPKGGHVLDPFAGSGTTGMACLAEGMQATLVEREAEYVADIRRRIAHVSGADTPLFAAAE